MKESDFDLNYLEKISKDLKKQKRNTTGYKEAKTLLVEYCEQHQTMRYSGRPGKNVGDYEIIDVPDNKRGKLERFRNKKIVEIAVGSGGLYYIDAIIIELPQME